MRITGEVLWMITNDSLRELYAVRFADATDEDADMQDGFPRKPAEVGATPLPRRTRVPGFANSLPALPVERGSARRRRERADRAPYRSAPDPEGNTNAPGIDAKTLDVEVPDALLQGRG